MPPNNGVLPNQLGFYTECKTRRDAPTGKGDRLISAGKWVIALVVLQAASGPSPDGTAEAEGRET